MKKNITAFIAMLSLLASCTAQQEGYQVKVKLDNPNKYAMYLAYANGKDYKIDTSYTMEDGWAVFKGKVAAPVVASFGVRGNPALFIAVGEGFIPGPGLEFFLSNDKIELTGSADQPYLMTVKGGQANKDWQKIKGRQAALTAESWMAAKRVHGNFKPGADSIAFKDLTALRERNLRADKALRKQFIAKHPGSIVSMYFLSGMVNDETLEQLKADYAKLDQRLQSTVYGERIAEKIKSMDQTAIGKQAVPIRKVDMDGKPVNLATLRGKYVLIDFWGSWCGPCRESHPHLKELYAKYKDKGLEILGIAQEQSKDLATNKKTWKSAVAQDGLPWIQVLNNEGMEQFDAVKAYGITAFPTKILLDKAGKIIGRYVGDEADFDEKIKEVFGF